MKSMKSRRLLIAALGGVQQMVLVAGALFGFGTSGWSNCNTWYAYWCYPYNVSTCHGTYCQATHDGGCNYPIVNTNKRCLQYVYKQWITPCSLPNDPTNCNVLTQEERNITTAIPDPNNPC